MPTKPKAPMPISHNAATSRPPYKLEVKNGGRLKAQAHSIKNVTGRDFGRQGLTCVVHWSTKLDKSADSKMET